MEVLYPCCCGLDLHNKKSIAACLLCALKPRGHISGQFCQTKGLEIVTLAICSPF